jgi:hypothetical protein
LATRIFLNISLCGSSLPTHDSAQIGAKERVS